MALPTTSLQRTPTTIGADASKCPFLRAKAASSGADTVSKIQEGTQSPVLAASSEEATFHIGRYEVSKPLYDAWKNYAKTKHDSGVRQQAFLLHLIAGNASNEEVIDYLSNRYLTFQALTEHYQSETVGSKTLAILNQSDNIAKDLKTLGSKLPKEPSDEMKPLLEKAKAGFTHEDPAYRDAFAFLILAAAQFGGQGIREGAQKSTGKDLFFNTFGSPRRTQHTMEVYLKELEKSITEEKTPLAGEAMGAALALERDIAALSTPETLKVKEDSHQPKEESLQKSGSQPGICARLTHWVKSVFSKG